jgi:hypothetical protein
MIIAAYLHKKRAEMLISLGSIFTHGVHAILIFQQAVAPFFSDVLHVPCSFAYVPLLIARKPPHKYAHKKAAISLSDSALK